VTDLGLVVFTGSLVGVGKLELGCRRRQAVTILPRLHRNQSSSKSGLVAARWWPGWAPCRLQVIANVGLVSVATFSLKLGSSGRHDCFMEQSKRARNCKTSSAGEQTNQLFKFTGNTSACLNFDKLHHFPDSATSRFFSYIHDNEDIQVMSKRF